MAWRQGQTDVAAPIQLSMTLRKAFLTLHLVAGLLSALILIVSSTTGCLLVFEKELHAAVNRKLMRVPARGDRLELAALVRQLEQARPDQRVTAVAPSLAANGATLVTMRPRQGGAAAGVYVDPYTAQVLGAHEARNKFAEQLRQFHRSLLLGEKGKLVTALGAAALIVLALTGVFLWWRQKLWRWSGSVSGRRRNFELHNVVGIYASVSILIFAITGLGVFWEKDATRVVNGLLGRPEPVAAKPVPPTPDARPLGIERIEAIAQAAAPGATLVSVEGIGGLRDPLKLRLRYIGDYSPARRTTLLLDPTTGGVLLSDGPSFKLWNQEMHTGEILGWPTRILSLLAALALTLLTLTGPLIWWGRRRRKAAQASVE